MQSGHSSGLRPINRLLILFHLTTSKKRVAINCRAERKPWDCCHLIPLRCDRETVGLDLCDLRRMPEATECVGIPRIPSSFEYEKVRSTKKSSPTCHHISSEKIFAIKLSRSCFYYDDNHCLWYHWRGQSRTSNVGSYEAQPRDTDDPWSYGLHRRKWNNCNGHGNIELPKSVKYLWILSILIKVMSQDPIWLHFEACSAVIQAMEPWTFCKWTFFLKKRLIFNFQRSISSLYTGCLTSTLFSPAPWEPQKGCITSLGSNPVTVTTRIIEPLETFIRHCWVGGGLDPKHPPFPVLDFWKLQNRLGSPQWVCWKVVEWQ